MSENGEEKLIAMARHIAKTLGHNESMADDILQIFSNFDNNRFSRDKLSSYPPSQSADPSTASLTLDHSLTSLERHLSRYIAADHPIWSDSADSSAFLECVDDLVATVRHFSPLASSDKSVAVCMERAEELLQQAMFRLEEEFRVLMERGAESFDVFRSSEGNVAAFESEEEEDGYEMVGDGDIPVAQPLSDDVVVIDALPSATINDLHEIAKRMVAARFDKECSHAYSSCRRGFLEESLSRLGLQKLSTEEVQKMTWQDLEEEIEKWTKAATIALRILFPSERRLCDRVFFVSSSAADFSFMEVCRGSTIQLLKFADAVAIGSRSPERLFKILDLYETMRDLMCEFEFNFSNHYCLVLRNNAVTILKNLGEAIRGIFTELENLIRRDPVKSPVPGGGLHPITRYVMNYLRAACRSSETLEQVFHENVSVVPMKDPPLSSLSSQIGWIMESLESNVEMKSKIYGDPALSSIFLMNNVRYIVQKVKDNELGLLLGDDWVRKRAAKVKQYQLSYQRNSWYKLLGVMKGDTESMAPNVPRKLPPMKEKIKLLNVQFDEMCRAQSQWIIYDEQLRKDLRVSIIKLLVPVYANFMSRSQNAPDIGRHTEKHFKYSVEELEGRINELFQ